VGDVHQTFYLMDISLSYYAQPVQQLLPDQGFWMTASGRFLPFVTLLPNRLLFNRKQPLVRCNFQ
jgi:hypothetical protein